ncbi:MAG: hypothetical protein H6Q17_22 [Bacteroidetes bacterium]|nr:hypothetical protein [Bacteroidota bacterium]
MKIKNIVEERINALWQTYKSRDFCKYPPLSVSEVPDEGIIFIGLNPSLDKNVKNVSVSPDANIEFYPLGVHKTENYAYFKKFSDIADKVQLPWGHLDLLYMRETKQQGIRHLLEVEDGINFIYQQLMVSKDILVNLLNEKKPLIFVVNNTLSRDFLGKDRPLDYSDDQQHWMDFRFKWSNELGTYLYNGHPFFFCSMLTGQRALDIGSYERLIWHIDFVKQKMNFNQPKNNLS